MSQFTKTRVEWNFVGSVWNQRIITRTVFPEIFLTRLYIFLERGNGWLLLALSRNDQQKISQEVHEQITAKFAAMVPNLFTRLGTVGVNAGCTHAESLDFSRERGKKRFLEETAMDKFMAVMEALEVLDPEAWPIPTVTLELKRESGGKVSTKGMELYRRYNPIG